jgi:hypothetical protein
LSRKKRSFNIGNTVGLKNILEIINFLGHATDKDTSKITLRNNSGGSAFAAIQLVQAVNSTACKVTFHCDGYLASAAAYIYVGCYNHIEKRSSGASPIFLMYHKPRLVSSIDGRNIFSKSFGNLTCPHASSINAAQQAEFLQMENLFDQQANMLFGLANDPVGEKLNNYNNFTDVCILMK